mmetsp:Transcript_25644/g.39733  ORF Transcript_25644/g.39733 Transcript_25644/m.39733 type:complete len:418 (-) Transcript_25644:1238-2491(-)
MSTKSPPPRSSRITRLDTCIIILIQIMITAATTITIIIVAQKLHDRVRKRSQRRSPRLPKMTNNVADPAHTIHRIGTPPCPAMHRILQEQTHGMLQTIGRIGGGCILIIQIPQHERRHERFRRLHIKGDQRRYDLHPLQGQTDEFVRYHGIGTRGWTQIGRNHVTLGSRQHAAPHLAGLGERVKMALISGQTVEHAQPGIGQFGPGSLRFELQIGDRQHLLPKRGLAHTSLAVHRCPLADAVCGGRADIVHQAGITTLLTHGLADQVHTGAYQYVVFAIEVGHIDQDQLFLGAQIRDPFCQFGGVVDYVRSRTINAVPQIIVVHDVLVVFVAFQYRVAIALDIAIEIHVIRRQILIVHRVDGISWSHGQQQGGIGFKFGVIHQFLNFTEIAGSCHDCNGGAEFGQYAKGSQLRCGAQ